MYRYRLLILNLVLVLAVFGSVWGRGIDSLKITNPLFLKELRLPFRDWQPTEESLDPDQLRQIKVLDPDAYTMREYQSPDGVEAELAVIAGHQKRSWHTPSFCLASDWEILLEEPDTISLPDGMRIPVTRIVMQYNNIQKMVTYFFTDGAYNTPSLINFQVVQQLKHFKSTIPLGALVRIIVPARGADDADAKNLSNVFFRATVPGVMAALRQERLHPR